MNPSSPPSVAEQPSVRRVAWLLFWLALPVLGEQLLNLGISQFDTYLAGRISKSATSAVGLAAYVGWGATLLFSLVGTGTTALISRCCGAGDRPGATLFFNQSLPLAVLIGCGAGGVFWNLAPVLASAQNLQGEAHRIAVEYLRADALSYPFTSVALVAGASLRGMGDMRTPFLIMVVVNTTNVLASTTLVYGWGPIAPWGVSGIVGGTVIARIVGGVWTLGLMLRGCSGLKIVWSELFPQQHTLIRILRIGVPALSESGGKWLGHFLFLGVITRLGDGAQGETLFAAHYIGINVEALTYLPAYAWGTATATLVGQSLGAGQPQQARWIAHLSMVQCFIPTLAASLFYYYQAEWIFQVMSNDPEVWAVGVPALRFLAFFQVPLSIALIYTLALNGAGDTRYPMYFTLVCTLGVRVPVAYVCGIVLDGGLIGAWSGMCLDNTLRGALVCTRYSRGQWTKLVV